MRCLGTERWGGNGVVMVIDAAFTSIGLHYFTVVVPAVEEFREKFVETEKVKTFKELAEADIKELREVWRNKRSWMTAKSIASSLSNESMEDRIALRNWAAHTNLQRWKEDPIGRIKGVGIVTFQYLRMMGGIDTVMPDKIVKRVINGILTKAGCEQVQRDLQFVNKVEEIASVCGYRPIELCWMIWHVQPEGKMMQ